MANLVRATAVLAVLWSVAAIGAAVDPSFCAWTGRLVLAVVGARI
jgi:hypothetical protein